MAKKKLKDPIRLNRLKIVLVEKNISQTDLAEMVGVDRNTISRICNNRNQPSIQLLFKIAVTLNVEVKELLSSLADIRDTFLKMK